MKLGRIPWINASPVYAAIDRGIVETDADIISGTAADLNDLLASGDLDLSVVSAVEYARDADSYLLLPELAISSDGPVHSVVLFSRSPIGELDGKTILLSSSSRTSVLLLELLCSHVWKVKPSFAQVPAEPDDLADLQQEPHQAVLVIGDAALHLRAKGDYPVMIDLGTAWKEWTGLPFVFAVWAARKESDREQVRFLHNLLLQSREWGMANLDLLAEEGAHRTGVPLSTVRSYLGDLDYRLSPAHIGGLTHFFNQLTADNRVPDGTLSFLTAA